MKYTLEVTVGDSLDSVVRQSAGCYIMQVSYQPYIKVEGYGEQQPIYASNVWWTQVKTLQAKILEMDSDIASMEMAGTLYEPGIKNTDYTFVIPANSHFKYLKCRKVSGTPTISFTIGDIEWLPSQELTSRAYIPIDLPYEVETNATLAISGGSVDIKYVNKENDWT